MSRQDSWRDFGRRWWALTKKESRQLLRDRSNLLLALGLPIILILIFGYGVSLDVRNVRMGVVIEQPSVEAVDIVSGMTLSRYFKPRSFASIQTARAALRDGDIEGIVRLNSDFSRGFADGDGHVQLILSGTDISRAMSIRLYFNQLVQQWAAKQVDRQGLNSGAGIQVVNRMWYNDANSSQWFLVPGLIVLIMTLVGTLQTALVMAREWERGTLEALFVSPVRPTEVLLAKITPYFVVGMMGLALCMLAARFLFEVPVQGSLWLILLGSMLYMLVSLGIGLLISAATKNQFLASQIAILASFMPAVMLSGFAFDLRNVPWFIEVCGYLLPATYFMELVRTLFLAGNVDLIVIRDTGILALYAVGLLLLARRFTRKRLD